MSIIDRVKNICLTPGTEWTVIEGEATSAQNLLIGYAAPLAAIGAVAGFIGGSIIGRTVPFVGTFRTGLFIGLVGAVFSFVMALVGVVILALIINALAPTFSARQDSGQAFKVAVYSFTPAWVAGVLHLLPLMGILVLCASLYGIYLMYLALPRLMKCPQDKAVGYTAVVVICAIVLSVVIGVAGAAVTGAGLIASGGLASMVTGSRTAPRDEAQVDKNSALGKLQEIGNKLDASSKKMEAAQKAGDTSGQAAAALDALGTVFGGGRRVEPLSVEDLKPFVPDTFAGLPRTSRNVERNGIAGLMVTKATATYGSDGKEISLEIADSGGVSGLVSLASWAGMQEEKEDQDGSERTMKEGGRLVHEKVSKTGGTNEYGIVLGERFMVSASSRDVDLNTLKAAIAALDLAKLESMKEAGVQK
jgi:hypothetical protein